MNETKGRNRTETNKTCAMKTVYNEADQIAKMQKIKAPPLLKIILTVMSIAVLTISGIGCNTTGNNASDSTSSNSTSNSAGSANVSSQTKSQAKPQKVTLVLDWAVNTNHVGIYVAKELGYFTAEGLEVNIVQAPEMNFVEMVGLNTAQFGICGQEQLSQARVTGKVPVVAIGAILQENTSGFASPADRGIKTPKDFAGKRYSGWGTPLEEKFIQSLMKDSGGDFSKVQMRMMAATDFFASMATEADFAWIYYGWDGIGAKVRNYPLNFILLQDVNPALNFYSPAFISNEKTISENPELVRKFMAAISKGYAYSVDNAEAASDLLLKYTPETDRVHAIESVKYLAKLFLDENKNFGVMKKSIWENFSQWMYDNKLLESKLDIDKSYTNEFLPAK